MKINPAFCRRCQAPRRITLWRIGHDSYCQQCFDWTIENTDIDLATVRRLSDKESLFEFPYVRKSKPSGTPAVALSAIHR